MFLALRLRLAVLSLRLRRRRPTITAPEPSPAPPVLVQLEARSSVRARVVAGPPPPEPDGIKRRKPKPVPALHLYRKPGPKSAKLSDFDFATHVREVMAAAQIPRDTHATTRVTKILIEQHQELEAFSRAEVANHVRRTIWNSQTFRPTQSF
jgi:hypothetical protein